ncbi:Reverse transcriptase (RNA-dependent DNA polymerase) [Rhizoctonia solani]|uniref:Reverse transcriptase (RNA-dependent DNA polymerase) n=1 Tax=Rhizoctonia solani TaxID=456999 RepID=A0A8H8PB65_9AGAM|nr:Reverse transcriptase (RNA-dependent DNA polymerase) [Rhizoctonia solani]QRW27053.1 Reverse transcriptase (RNA-dependent DNA polymerase) [Rhizoctonia solani]
MSLPKNYRPIALLETLSKLLEKVITTRLTFEAGKHTLIPHSQFGGRDITSCTDAGICMIHDIKTHWKSNHRVSLITLDVSGYFNNVDHSRLIYTLDRMGYSNQICNWLKSYLSHRTAQFRVDGHLCPPIALPLLHLTLNGKNSTILPQGCIRWLGFFLDRKLLFKEHILNSANKAKAVIAGLRMLANTQRGHHQTRTHPIHHLRHPHPHIWIPLWFLGRRQKSLLEPLRKVQNQGLRWLLGAFKTTPIPCLEHLASIPPLHITCKKLIMNYATKLRTIPKLSQVAKRLPESWDTHTPTLNSNRNTRPRTWNPPSISLHHIATHIEFVTPHINHPSNPSIPFPDQIKIKDTTDGLKRDEYRNKILSEISVLEECHASVLGYSDGHAAVSNGIRKVGVGYVIRAGKRTLSSSSIGIGPRANIYDAEMLGILLAFMKAKQIAENQGYRKIRIYCDNQSAVKSIADLSRHPCQYASRIFVPAAKAFVEGHPERSIHITWTPGHNGVEGNERADRLANEGARVAPTPLFNRTITWAKEQATRKTVRSWKKAWYEHSETRINSKYYIPRPPALKLHPIFNSSKLGRDIECRLVQYLTGHGHYGEYHAQFHHDVDPRGILSEFSTNINDPTLFGSLAGLEAVAKFIAKTGIGRRRGGPQAAAQTITPGFGEYFINKLIELKAYEKTKSDTYLEEMTGLISIAFASNPLTLPALGVEYENNPELHNDFNRAQLYAALTGAGRVLGAFVNTDGHERLAGVSIWYEPGNQFLDDREGLGDGAKKNLLHLQVIGTHPEFQKGIGKAMVKHMLAQSDSRGIASCVETSKESNLLFYTGLGYEVKANRTIPSPYGDLTMRCLYRDPSCDKCEGA